MSSSSNARVPVSSSRGDRRTATENGSQQPRAPSAQTGSKNERPDPRRTQSPQPSATSASHRRGPSGSQRSKREVEERRTERVLVTTRETVISRTRSPDRRSAVPQQPERTRPPEPSRQHAVDHRPRSAPKPESPQGKSLILLGNKEFLMY
jgi:gamma-tubulin complex component 2